MCIHPYTLEERLAILGALAVWTTTLFMPAIGLGGYVDVRWYNGMMMFFAGLVGQVATVINIFDCVRDGDLRRFLALSTQELAWSANVIFWFFCISALVRKQPVGLPIILPLVLALFAFGVKTFAVPDDSPSPVIAYGAGFWLWLLAMLIPIVARAGSAISPRRRSEI